MGPLRASRSIGRLGLLACCGLLLARCDAGPQPEPAGQVQGAVSGQDGPLTVGTPGTIVNRYAALQGDAAAGSTTVTLASAALQPLLAGDLILIIQMQGATIDTSDSPSFGNVTALGSAGLFEYVTVASVSGNTITLAAGCGLKNSYSAAGKTQVVRVPQYTTLQVSPAGSITAPAWNGSVGGIVAVRVQGAAQIDGKIDVSGLGFRGGQLHNMTADNTGTNVIYASGNLLLGGDKGESIAGSVNDYQALGVRYGRGAPANGGGGGDSHNAAGGGGANGDDGSAWTGQGVMLSGVGAVAWTLDPGYVANGNMLTTSAGGGRGGYSFSQTLDENPPNPTLVGPGNKQWQADFRRDVGGLGGRPLKSDPSSHLYFGGGGGAGDENNDSGGPGGNGGGLIALVAGSVAGKGQLLANGAAGGNTTATGNGITCPCQGNDAAGGGGGGGTVVVYSTQAGGVQISATGGLGGNQISTQYLLDNGEAEGPGGGGGGGFVATPPGIAASVLGGTGGVTGAASLALFPANGATAGGAGVDSTMAPAQPPICPAQTPPDMRMAGTPDLRLVGNPDGRGNEDGGVEKDGGEKDGGLVNSDAGGADMGTRYVGGCSAVPGSSGGPAGGGGAAGTGLALLALLGLYRQRARRALSGIGAGKTARILAIVPLVFFWMTESKAHAQSSAGTPISANAETFQPAIGPENIITVEGSRTSGTLRPMAQALFEFSYRPIRLISVASGDTLANTVPSITTLHLMAGLGLTRWLSIAADLPVVLYQDFDRNTPTSDVPNAPSTTGVADFRLTAKFRLINNQDGGFGLAFVPQVTFPTGNGKDLRGDDAYGILPRLALDYKWSSGTILALNVGFLGRTSDQVLRDMKITSQVRYGLGVLFPIDGGFAMLAELAGGTAVQSVGAIYSPFEGHIAGRYTHPTGVQAEVGVGTGFTQAVGSPEFRVYASVGYLPVGEKPRVPLFVAKTGTGTGVVTSVPGGLECGPTCTSQTAHFRQGTEVVLTAQPGADSALVGWSGACHGTDVCRVPLNEATLVNVEFVHNEPPKPPEPDSLLAVEIKGPGTGQVISEPAGIDCSPLSIQCSRNFKAGTAVRLTARPDKGSSFGGWSEPRCGLERVCEVPVNGMTRVEVTFSQRIPPPPHKGKMSEYEIQFRPCSKDIVNWRTNVVLEYYARFLAGRPTLQMSIEGHTDDILCPSGPYKNDNLKLSNDRAAAAADALAWWVHKIDASQGDAVSLRGRLHELGFGAACPVADIKADKDARAKNRRTEFWEYLPGLGSTSECAHLRHVQETGGTPDSPPPMQQSMPRQGQGQEQQQPPMQEQQQ